MAGALPPPPPPLWPWMLLPAISERFVSYSFFARPCSSAFFRGKSVLHVARWCSDSNAHFSGRESRWRITFLPHFRIDGLDVWNCEVLQLVCGLDELKWSMSSPFCELIVFDVSWILAEWEWGMFNISLWWYCTNHKKMLLLVNFFWVNFAQQIVVMIWGPKITWMMAIQCDIGIYGLSFEMIQISFIMSGTLIWNKVGDEELFCVN